MKKATTKNVTINTASSATATTVTTKKTKEQLLEEQRKINAILESVNNITKVTKVKDAEKKAKLLIKQEKNKNKRLDVLVNFEKAFLSENDYAKELYAIGNYVVYSVLKKLIGATGGTNYDVLSGFKNDVSRARYYFNELEYINNQDGIQFDKDGNIVLTKEFEKKALKNGFKFDYMSQDGLDLVHDAIVSILEDINNNVVDCTKKGFLEKKYSYRTLGRKVYFKDNKPTENDFKTVETCIIVNAFRAVRHSIESKHALVANQKFVYLEDIFSIIMKNDNIISYRIYQRQTRPTFKRDYKTQVKKIKALKLSVKERETLDMYMLGYSTKAITKILNTDKRSINSYKKRIVKKAIDAGIVSR